MRSLKIAHVIQRYLPAQLTGSENYIRYISEGLAKRGHEVTVLTSNAFDGKSIRDPVRGKFIKEKVEEINGVKVLRFKVNHFFSGYPLLGFIRNKIPLQSIGNSFAFSETARTYFSSRKDVIGGIKNLLTTLCVGPYTPQLYDHLVKSSYELVHVTPFPLTNVWIAARAARKTSIPLVCTPFMKVDPSFWMLFNSFFYDVLVQSRAIFAGVSAEKELIASLSIDPKKIHIVPMGITPDDCIGGDGNSFRKKFELEDTFIVLFAGQKTYEKGAIQVLQSMSLLAKRHTNIAFLAIGFSSPVWEHEKRKVNNIKIIDLPYLSGQDKKDAFDACDLFVMPSRIDSFGIVYLEAWMCGKPVIGARINFITDVIRENVDGYLVEFGNAEQLAQKIENLIGNEALRRKLGQNGKERVLANFTWSRIVSTIEKLYETFLDRRDA